MRGKASEIGNGTPADMAKLRQAGQQAGGGDRTDTGCAAQALFSCGELLVGRDLSGDFGLDLCDPALQDTDQAGNVSAHERVAGLLETIGFAGRLVDKILAPRDEGGQSCARRVRRRRWGELQRTTHDG
jgi:hypothetical protein